MIQIHKIHNYKKGFRTSRFTLTGNPGRPFSIGFSVLNASYRQVRIGFPPSELFVGDP